MIGFLILLTVREPRRGQNFQEQIKEHSNSSSDATTRNGKIKQLLKLMRPSLLILCIASSIRNAGKTCVFKQNYFCFQKESVIFYLLVAGYVWAYNTQVYFDSIGQTPTQIGFWMSWIPVVGGSIGNYFLMNAKKRKTELNSDLAQ